MHVECERIIFSVLNYIYCSLASMVLSGDLDLQHHSTWFAMALQSDTLHSEFYPVLHACCGNGALPGHEYEYGEWICVENNQLMLGDSQQHDLR